LFVKDYLCSLIKKLRSRDTHESDRSCDMRWVRRIAGSANLSQIVPEIVARVSAPQMHGEAMALQARFDAGGGIRTIWTIQSCMDGHRAPLHERRHIIWHLRVGRNAILTALVLLSKRSSTQPSG